MTVNLMQVGLTAQAAAIAAEEERERLAEWDERTREETPGERRLRQENEGARLADDCFCSCCGARGVIGLCGRCSNDLYGGGR